MGKDDIFKVAMLQMKPMGNLAENIEKGVKFCRKAKDLGADIAVFPEMWSNGYEQLFAGCDSTYCKDNQDFPKEKLDEWLDKAVHDDSEFVQTFTNLAKELEMAIAMTYFEKTENKPRNTVLVVDRFGKKILKYSKVHTVDWQMEHFLEPGKEFVVSELDYGRGKVKLGAMICFDRTFPESARVLMLKGAEIIIIPNACAMQQIRRDQLKVRAFENMAGVVLVNYPDDDQREAWGKSGAYSPVWRDSQRNELDTVIVEMGEGEDIAIADFDLREIREFRGKGDIVIGNRKPQAYEELVK
ncbi:carbon-nitrogen hydrolase family protein [Candidatus Saccharibacteria bacterium]|nr:carbon-nitrogen hydrolase family protein [Candidatus Saccharibacteria bacterium]